MEVLLVIYVYSMECLDLQIVDAYTVIFIVVAWRFEPNWYSWKI